MTLRGALKPRKRRRPLRLEQAMHISIAVYLRVVLRKSQAIFFHVPNGGQRTKAEGGILKQMGTRAGVLDLQLIWRDPVTKSTRFGFIELKYGDEEPSDDQLGFMADLDALGVPYAVCRSLDEVKVVLYRWGVPCRDVDLLTPGKTVTQSIHHLPAEGGANAA